MSLVERLAYAEQMKGDYLMVKIKISVQNKTLKKHFVYCRLSSRAQHLFWWLNLDVPQSVLETVIPKVDPRFILFVQGEHRGLVRINYFVVVCLFLLCLTCLFCQFQIAFHHLLAVYFIYFNLGWWDRAVGIVQTTSSSSNS